MIDLVEHTASDEYLDFDAFDEALEVSHKNIHMLLGAGIGLSGEVGEFNEIIKKHVWQKKSFNEDHAKKELGDIYWYFALACKALNTTPKEIADLVKEKLKERYQGGRFSLELNENRKPNDY